MKTPLPQSLRDQLDQLSIPLEFAEEKAKRLQDIWSEEAFLAKVTWHWRREGSNFRPRQSGAGKAQGTLIPENWKPDDSALKVLEDAKVLSAFAMFCLPDFIQYWRERGESCATWNNRFIQHVKQQSRYYARLWPKHGLPSRIPLDWRPSMVTFEILDREKIDNQFAINLIQEFVMYWHESERMQYSWSVTFLHFVRERWRENNKACPKTSKAMSSTDDFDRSWAEGVM